MLRVMLDETGRQYELDDKFYAHRLAVIDVDAVPDVAGEGRPTRSYSN